MHAPGAQFDGLRTRKGQEKEYADAKRSAEYNDIVKVDQTLLNKSRENKLPRNFEPAPYKVI